MPEFDANNTFINPALDTSAMPDTSSSASSGKKMPDSLKNPDNLKALSSASGTTIKTVSDVTNDILKRQMEEKMRRMQWQNYTNTAAARNRFSDARSNTQTSQNVYQDILRGQPFKP